MAPLQFFRRIWQRHRWSVPLSMISAVFFAKLGSEVREKELDAFDAAMQTMVNGWRGSFDQLMVFLTTGGGFYPMVLLVTASVILLAAAGKGREARFLLFCSLGCVLLNVFLKWVFHRARPFAEPAYLLPRPHSLSFPSGHTMGCAGAMGGLAVVVRVLRPPRALWVSFAVFSAAMILGVALSRVYLGAHYPSDVLGGLFAAASWISALTGWFYPRLLPHERTNAAAP